MLGRTEASEGRLLAQEALAVSNFCLTGISFEERSSAKIPVVPWRSTN
jgi:hypothetical protein